MAVLDSEYARATLKLREDILQYAELVRGRHLQRRERRKSRAECRKGVCVEGATGVKRDWVEGERGGVKGKVRFARGRALDVVSFVRMRCGDFRGEGQACALRCAETSGQFVICH